MPADGHGAFAVHGAAVQHGSDADEALRADIALLDHPSVVAAAEERDHAGQREHGVGDGTAGAVDDLAGGDRPDDRMRFQKGERLRSQQPEETVLRQLW